MWEKRKKRVSGVSCALVFLGDFLVRADRETGEFRVYNPVPLLQPAGHTNVWKTLYQAKQHLPGMALVSGACFH